MSKYRRVERQFAVTLVVIVATVFALVIYYRHREQQRDHNKISVIAPQN